MTDEYVGALDSLTVPDADRDRLKSWIADERRGQLLLLQLAKAFTARDDQRISTLSQRIDTLASANDAFATGYGMPRCAGTAKPAT